MQTTKEKRQYSRLLITNADQVECHLLTPDQLIISHFCVVSDISVQGLYIITDCNLQQDAELLVDLKIAGESYYPLPVTVMRTDDCDDDRYGAVLQFQEHHRELQKVIDLLAAFRNLDAAQFAA